MAFDPSLYPWLPPLEKVAAHIPSRTRDVVTNLPLGTFTADTYPTGDQVDLLTEAAVSIVAGMVGTPIVPAAYDLCEAAAALWCAYSVELAWPDRDANVAVYMQLRADALLLIEKARAQNLGAGGGTVDPPDEDGVVTQLPSWSFPDPVIISL